ncbi:MAG: hypothetical protein D6820_01910, partial [Lentisphaerae bacterium]
MKVFVEPSLSLPLAESLATIREAEAFHGVSLDYRMLERHAFWEDEVDRSPMPWGVLQHPLSESVIEYALAHPRRQLTREAFALLEHIATRGAALRLRDVVIATGNEKLGLDEYNQDAKRLETAMNERIIFLRRARTILKKYD